MEKLRNFLQSWPGRITMGLILVPMAFLGVQGIGGGGALGSHEVIRVGDASIGLNEFQSELNRYRTQLLQTNDASMIREEVLVDEVIETLVGRALLQNQAHVLGMAISDEQISRLIAQDESFHQNGQFSNDIFAMFLQQNHLTKDELFQRFRTQLNIRQLTAGILGTAIYPDEQISRLLDLQSETREIWVHRLNWQDYAQSVSVSQAEIDDYYNANKDALVQPESVDLSYIELSPNDVKIDPPTQADIAAQFDVYLEKNGVSDGRELAQILLSGADAQNRANEVQAKLDAGESFEELAKSYSDDPSGESGGYIGQYNPSVFGNDAAEVNLALSGLKVGEVSRPVKTKFGYQFFKLTKAGGLTIDSVHDELVQMAMRNQRQIAYNDLIEKINTMATDGMGISDIAMQTGLEAKSIKNYPKQDNHTVLSQPAVIAAAFDEFTIEDQAVSANITLGDKTVWVQPSNHQEPKTLTLAQASDDIKVRLTQQKAIQLAFDAANRLADEAKKNGVRSLMTPSTHFGIIARQNPRLLPQERSGLFLHNSGADDVWAVKTDDGASVIVGGPVSMQATTQLSANQRAQAAMMIRDNIGQDQLSDYIWYLKNTNDVAINRNILR